MQGLELTFLTLCASIKKKTRSHSLGCQNTALLLPSLSSQAGSRLHYPLLMLSRLDQKFREEALREQEQVSLKVVKCKGVGKNFTKYFNVE